MARFLRRAVDRLVQAESDTITVDTFYFQAMLDHADTLYTENQQLHAAITSAVSILDPHTVDPWAYRPGSVPEHAEDVRAAVSVLAGCLDVDAVRDASVLAEARQVVASALANSVDSDVLLSELRRVLHVPGVSSTDGAAA